MAPVHDILIVGGGGAGLRAAIAVAEINPQLDIALVSKVYPMRSHTVAAEGGTAAVIKENDSIEDHINDTITGSDWMADQDAVELFVNEAPAELIQLEHWGCPWSREPDGRVAVRPFGGMRIERTWFAADKTGFHLLHALFQTSLKYTSITRYDESFATKLLVENGRCQGVTAVELRSGMVQPVLAKAVIMCTGGAGRIFPFTTNGAIKTGDGMALAYRAGVALKDMEFVQYHPTGLPGTGILMTEASRGEGGYLVNNKGDRYLSEYIPGKMELGPRDILSRAFMYEMREGRVFDGPYGNYVHLDLRHLGEKVIDEKLPFVRELSRNYVGIDPVQDPIPVRPVVHYMMGGVHTDIDGVTPIPGLYAAGEAACVSLNGANRLGSNSLTECLVFGARAGRAAATFAAGVPAPGASVEAQVRDEKRRLEDDFFNASGRTERIADVRSEMQAAMEGSAGIYRTGASITAGAETVGRLQAHAQRLRLEDRSRTFNTELTAALELGYMLELAQVILRSAEARTESRGAHQRTDHPQRDDERFLAHSLAYRTDGGPPRIEYSPVTITRWPPGERVYGR
jgi:fumarate reductase flavoprotein subunit